MQVAVNRVMNDLFYPNFKNYLQVPFQKIDDEEVPIIDFKLLEKPPMPLKIQMVALPFNRDDGGVKIGFKSIKLTQPNF